MSIKQLQVLTRKVYIYTMYNNKRNIFNYNNDVKVRNVYLFKNDFKLFIFKRVIETKLDVILRKSSFTKEKYLLT